MVSILQRHQTEKQEGQFAQSHPDYHQWLPHHQTRRLLDPPQLDSFIHPRPPAVNILTFIKKTTIEEDFLQEDLTRSSSFSLNSSRTQTAIYPRPRGRLAHPHFRIINFVSSEETHLGL